MANLDKKNLTVGNTAHYYALMSWNGMDSETALKEASEKSFEDLDKETYAGGSLNAAVKGIEKHLFDGFSVDDLSEVVHGKKGFSQDEVNAYLHNIGKYTYETNGKNPQVIYEKVLDIISEIHDEWVRNNAKKYDRDKDADDKRLFQHLPMELIGIVEVGKDMLFLSPLMDRLGMRVGEMQEVPYGNFVPNEQMEQVYNQRVQRFLHAHGIDSEEALKNYLENVVKDYIPLKSESAPEGKQDLAEKRAKYMSQDEQIKNMIVSIRKNCNLVDKMIVAEQNSRQK